MARPSPLTRRTPRGIVALAMLALVLRLAATLLPMPAMALGGGTALDDLLAGGGICHVDPVGTSTPAPADRQAEQCRLCPFCIGLGSPLPVADPILPPAPVAFAAVDRLAPPATGPPARQYSRARPRGPPSLSA